MTQTIYSQNKAAWHADRLADLRAGVAPKPVHVQLILSDLCNQDCSFCAYRMSSGLSRELFGTAKTHNPNRMIPTAKATEIVLDCAELGVKAIQFTGGGEPTVHPAHLELFELAQRLGMETSLVTNGVKLDPEHDAVLGHTWIRVSVDAGDPETYAKVRRVPIGHWNKVWGNVRQLASAYAGRLGIGFVVTPDNWKGIYSAAAIAKNAGAQNLRVGAVFSADGSDYYPTGLAELVQEQINEAKALDGDGFEVMDLFGRRIGDLDAGHPEDPRCGYQHFTWYVGGDLNLYRCCNVAYTTRGRVGSLQGRRLAELLGAHEPFDARACTACQFNGQNKAIAELVQIGAARPSGDAPEHVNFV